MNKYYIYCKAIFVKKIFDFPFIPTARPQVALDSIKVYSPLLAIEFFIVDFYYSDNNLSDHAKWQ